MDIVLLYPLWDVVVLLKPNFHRRVYQTYLKKRGNVGKEPQSRSAAISGIAHVATTASQ